MEFRLATKLDAISLAEYESEYIECPWSRGVIENTIDDELSSIYLLCDGGQTLGYGGYKMALDTAELYNIVVLKEFRRKGYARLILQKIIDGAVENGAKEMFLEVNEGNAAAISLYTSFGFDILSSRKNYYKSGNALVMKLNL